MSYKAFSFKITTVTLFESEKEIMTIKNIAKEQILERLKFENEWWETGEIPKFYSELGTRSYFSLLRPLIVEKGVNRAVVLMGPRRVGKTVLIFQIIQSLINENINPRKIFYLSIDNPIYNSIPLEQLYKYCKEAVDDQLNNDFFVFFDEIQYLKNWEVHLKIMVDSYNTAKFTVTGSAAAALRLKSNESGAGRFTDFLLPPLTFYEYLQLLKKESFLLSKKENAYVVPSNYNYTELNDQFIKYINFGGYPEVIFSETIQNDPTRYIKSDIIDKVLLKDLPILYGIQDIQELNSLFNTLAYNSGYEVSLDEISKNSGVARNTIKKYLTYLESAFLIKIINRIDKKAKKFERANYFKIYLTNPSIRSALFTPIKPSDYLFGNIVETAIYSQFQHSTTLNINYARWKGGEVDIVYLDPKQNPLRAVEVKWSNRFVEKIRELENLNSFCKLHKIKDCWVTTIDIFKTVKDNDLLYRFIPSSLYALYISQFIMEGKLGQLEIEREKT